MESAVRVCISYMKRKVKGTTKIISGTVRGLRLGYNRGRVIREKGELR